MVPLNQLYKAILISLGKNVADDGKVSDVDGDGELTPTMVLDKRLTLATAKVLDASPWNEQIAFHPLSENVTLNESQIQSWLRGAINERVTIGIVMLLTSALVVASSPATHQKLKARQKKFLSVIPEVSDDLLSKWEKAVLKINAHKQYRLFNLYLTKAGEMNGQLYQRLASVSFPIMNDLSEPSVRQDAQGKNVKEYKIFDVKFSKGEWETIRDLFLHFFPDAVSDGTAPTKYSVGSNSALAPFFDASIRAYLKIAEILNTHAETFDGAFDVSDIRTDLSWVTFFDNIASYKNQLPNNLEGNEGVRPFQQKDVVAEMKNNTVKAAQQRPTATAPAAAEPAPVIAEPAKPAVAPVVINTTAPGQRDNGQAFREATTAGASAPGAGLSHLRRNMGQGYLGHPQQQFQQQQQMWGQQPPQPPQNFQQNQWPYNQQPPQQQYGGGGGVRQPVLGTAARNTPYYGDNGGYPQGGYPNNNYYNNTPVV